MNEFLFDHLNEFYIKFQMPEEYAMKDEEISCQKHFHIAVPNTQLDTIFVN